MKRIDWNALADSERRDALARPAQSSSAETRAAVGRTLESVRSGGDAALIELTRRFDRCELESLRVSEAEFLAAERSLSQELKAAIIEARQRIELFHRACALQPVRVETAPGVICERILRPIERVGLYVPAGGAPLPSTALMLGVPAQIAGCRDVVMCTPPRVDGRCDEAVLFAARACGIGQVFKLGGAQAIAAMAYGSESVPRCDKLFGPGNVWVTEAKIQVATDARGVAIDMPAGPSEVLVIADAQAAVISAGSIFLGAWSPESVGDYCSGTNHVLPTYAATKAWSGLSVASFQKQISMQELSADGLRAIGPCAVTLARAEQLDAHAYAVSLRLESLEDRA